MGTNEHLMDLWVVRKIHSALDLRYHVGHVLLRLQTMSSAPGQDFHDNLYIGSREQAAATTT